MPLGKLIYMPEESTPTVATLGNTEAVAYMELGEHTDYYGQLFSKAPEMLDKLLDIKRLAESGDDSGYEPYTLLDLIAEEARAALALACVTSSAYRVGSSHGELTIDSDGYVIDCHVDNDAADGGGHLLRITRFDLAEWRKHWGDSEAESVDILDLGYWCTDPVTNKTTYAPPDTNWRTEISRILLHRRFTRKRRK